MPQESSDFTITIAASGWSASVRLTVEQFDRLADRLRETVGGEVGRGGGDSDVYPGRDCVPAVRPGVRGRGRGRRDGARDLP